MYNDRISVNSIKNNGIVVYIHSYLNNLLNSSDRYGYNSGYLGWNYDIYKINNTLNTYNKTNLYIVNGNRSPETKYSIDYKTIKILDDRFYKQNEILHNKLLDKKIGYKRYRTLLEQLKNRQYDYLYNYIMKNLKKFKK